MLHSRANGVFFCAMKLIDVGDGRGGHGHVFDSPPILREDYSPNYARSLLFVVAATSSSSAAATFITLPRSCRDVPRTTTHIVVMTNASSSNLAVGFPADVLKSTTSDYSNRRNSSASDSVQSSSSIGLGPTSGSGSSSVSGMTPMAHG